MAHAELELARRASPLGLSARCPSPKVPALSIGPSQSSPDGKDVASRASSLRGGGIPGDVSIGSLASWAQTRTRRSNSTSSNAWGIRRAPGLEDNESDAEEGSGDGSPSAQSGASSACCRCLTPRLCGGRFRRCCVGTAARCFCVWSALEQTQRVNGAAGEDSGDDEGDVDFRKSDAAEAGAAACPDDQGPPAASSDQDDPADLERKETRQMREVFSLLESSAFRADEEETRRRNHTLRVASKQHLIHPFSWLRTRWDVLLVLVISYNAFVISFRIAFDVSEEVDGLFWFDRFVDLLFIADLFLNFRTGIVTDSGAVVLDPEVIVWTYLRGWFAIDFVSAIPYEVFFIIAAPDAYNPELSAGMRAPSMLRISQMIRIFKAVKMLRILRLSQVFTRWERAFVVKHAVSTVTRYFVAIFFAAHWIACAFFLVGSSEASSGSHLSWIEDQNLVGASLFEQYMASFYWALTTVTTGEPLPEPSSHPSRCPSVILAAWLNHKRGPRAAARAALRTLTLARDLERSLPRSRLWRHCSRIAVRARAERHRNDHWLHDVHLRTHQYHHRRGGDAARQDGVSRENGRHQFVHGVPWRSGVAASKHSHLPGRTIVQRQIVGREGARLADGPVSAAAGKAGNRHQQRRPQAHQVPMAYNAGVRHSHHSEHEPPTLSARRVRRSGRRPGG